MVRVAVVARIADDDEGLEADRPAEVRSRPEDAHLEGGGEPVPVEGGEAEEQGEEGELHGEELPVGGAEGGERVGGQDDEEGDAGHGERRARSGPPTR